MAELLYQDQTLDRIDFTLKQLSGAEFDTCVFNNCNLAGMQLARALFRDCVFNNCNLSNATLDGTKFQEAAFTNSKLLGLNFYKCADFLFTVSFEGCNLDFTSFSGKKLKKTLFKNCSLKEANFSECDLSEAKFLTCDLTQTLFSRTNLAKVDFRTAYNFNIDAEINNLKKAKFSAAGLPGLLTKYDILVD